MQPAGVDHNMDDEIDSQRFQSTREVSSDDERRKAKKAKNTETVKHTLKVQYHKLSQKPQQTRMLVVSCFPPDNDRFQSAASTAGDRFQSAASAASSVSSKVRGRPKKTQVSRFPPNSVQVSEFKR